MKVGIVDTLPKPDPEFYKARDPLRTALFAAIEPDWQRFLAGEIFHDEYCILIAPHTKAYSKALRPAWLAAGGTCL